MATPSVIINLEPNWDNEPEVSYGFSTVVQDTPYFKQQRRPLVPTPTRMQNCKYTFIDADIQYARNLLLYAAPRLCYIPIYSEPVQAGAVTQGASAITALTDITYYWNLQNCDYAIILNFLTGQSEAVVVASVSGQVINLTGAIVQSWDAASCVIYPAFAGRISAMKETAVTSRLLELDAQFEEISIGEVATKVWVGLDEQVCVGETGFQGFSFLDFTEVDLNYITELPASFLTLNADGYSIANALNAYTTCYSINGLGILPVSRARFKFSVHSVSGSGSTDVNVLYFSDAVGYVFIYIYPTINSVNFLLKDSSYSDSSHNHAGITYPFTRWVEVDFTVAGTVTVRVFPTAGFSSPEYSLVGSGLSAASPVFTFVGGASIINSSALNFSLDVSEVGVEIV